ncbi:ras association domain-containing protein 4 [Anabrus simplex]|uniref:ras association domain-containing protein 4 n=1 Tax=Anabrus simplex TaxID=316456 RepID=UPI0035A279D7
MWKCHKCGKPVYFAERKQSLGYDWHPECLRCEECGKRLNPGQHAEHKGVPYCHVPCYGALFGPQLFGHGTRVESHTSFGKVENRSGGPNLPRSHLESKLKVFNGFYDGKSGEVRSREVNGRLVLEGALRIHWGVLGMIHLKEDDDQRTVVTIRKRNSCRGDTYNGVDFEDLDSLTDISVDGNRVEEPEVDVEEPLTPEPDACLVTDTDRKHKALTLPPKLDVKQIDWDELDDLLQVERKVDDSEKLYQTMPGSISTQSSIDCSDVTSHSISTQSSVDTTESFTSDEGHRNGCTCDELANMEEFPSLEKNLNRSLSGPECLERHWDEKDLRPAADEEVVVLRRAAKTGSTAIRRRPGTKRRSRTKLKRRCSINGHFYNRETSFFTPPHGSQMSVWVTSLVNTQEVINLLLEKYKVDSKPTNFALFVVRDNGEQRRLRDDEYPLLVRVMLGPHEDVAKLFLMDRQNTEEISCEVAQFLNLSITECRAILERYQEEEERETKRVRLKFREMRRRIKQRMEDLKVRL